MNKQKKINILDKTPSVSRKEIESYMDFDKVLKGASDTATVGNQFFKGTFVIIGILLVGVMAYQYFTNDTDFSKSESANKKIVDKELSQLTPETPITLESERIVENTPEKKEPIIISNAEKQLKERRKEPTPKENTVKSKGDNSVAIPKEDKTSEETSYTYIEAIPVEGLTYLYAYFRENLTYPNELRKDSIEGVVLISFTVLRDSTVSNVQVVQSLGEKFDNEAIRVINNMPKWIPATVNETPVNSKLSIPLTFNIEK